MSKKTDKVQELDLKNPSGGTLVVGDLHGCAEELERLLKRASFRHGRDRLVMVGDLFVKGPAPVETARMLQDLGALTVLGNHDAILLKRRGGLTGQDEHAQCARLLEEGSPWVWKWLEEAPLALRLPGGWVVHGGIDPRMGVSRTSRSDFLNLRRLEDTPGRPFWWEKWQGPERVVFGHDARRGLVWQGSEKQPVAVGLDTGCVYGGRLTGLWWEERHLVSVGATRMWTPVPRLLSPQEGGRPSSSSSIPASPPS